MRCPGSPGGCPPNGGSQRRHTRITMGPVAYFLPGCSEFRFCSRRLRVLMGERCQIDELRTLFLFEHLSDPQLEMLCADGHIETIPAGPLFSEGEPATCFYVLIEGELVMSARTAGVDVQTNRTSQRGAYCGAWSAYVPDAEQKYAVSVRL